MHITTSNHFLAKVGGLFIGSALTWFVIISSLNEYVINHAPYSYIAICLNVIVIIVGYLVC